MNDVVGGSSWQGLTLNNKRAPSLTRYLRIEQEHWILICKTNYLTTKPGCWFLKPANMNGIVDGSSWQGSITRRHHHSTSLFLFRILTNEFRGTNILVFLPLPPSFMYLLLKQKPWILICKTSCLSKKFGSWFLKLEEMNGIVGGSTWQGLALDDKKTPSFYLFIILKKINVTKKFGCWVLKPEKIHSIVDGSTWQRWILGKYSTTSFLFKILTNSIQSVVCGVWEKNKWRWQGLTLDNKRAPSFTRSLPALMLHSFINSTMTFELFVRALFQYLLDDKLMLNMY